MAAQTEASVSVGHLDVRHQEINNMKTEIGAILACTIFIVGCRSTNPSISTSEMASSARSPWFALYDESKSITIDPSNGISQVEAFRIACDYYVSSNENLIGSIDIPIEETSQWRVPVFEGFAPRHSKDLLVSKATGQITVSELILLSMPTIGVSNKSMDRTETANGLTKSTP